MSAGREREAKVHSRNLVREGKKKGGEGGKRLDEIRQQRKEYRPNVPDENRRTVKQKRGRLTKSKRGGEKLSRGGRKSAIKGRDGDSILERKPRG